LKILIINPGSTSTKFAVYQAGNIQLEKTLRHSEIELAKYHSIAEQYEFRYQLIKSCLIDNTHVINTFKGIIGRGGLLKPIKGGVYMINEQMLQDLKSCAFGEHASNLGAILAFAFSLEAGCPAFIADPVVVDEMDELARISGVEGIKRKSIFHALNQKAAARKTALQLNKPYESINLIVAHLGGGISIGAHQRGQVIDVNNALDGDGPFSPERSGSLPIGNIVNMCFSGKYSENEIRLKLKGKGGLVSYLNTNDAYEVQKKVEAGDSLAMLIYQAMAYQVSKSIGEQATVLKGQVDAIVLTGGIAHDQKHFIPWIKERTSFIAPIVVFPGEDELQALHDICIQALRGELKIKQYC
jgi:butyrate kinase